MLTVQMISRGLLTIVNLLWMILRAFFLGANFPPQVLVFGVPPNVTERAEWLDLANGPLFHTDFLRRDCLVLARMAELRWL